MQQQGQRQRQRQRQGQGQGQKQKQILFGDDNKKCYGKSKGKCEGDDKCSKHK